MAHFTFVLEESSLEFSQQPLYFAPIIHLQSKNQQFWQHPY
jgi:hypothetical protein